MRFYDKWAGNPKGIAENPEKCIASVWHSFGWGHALQCTRKRGKGPDGLYCGQHAKKADAGYILLAPKDEEK